MENFGVGRIVVVDGLDVARGFELHTFDYFAFLFKGLFAFKLLSFRMRTRTRTAEQLLRTKEAKWAYSDCISFRAFAILEEE